MAELIAAVHVKDPERPGVVVQFLPGDDVPDRFWPYMTNPALWRDGEVPEVVPEPDGQSDDSGSNGAPEPAGEPEPEKKPAARKAAPKTGSRRQAAAEGTGGQ